MFYAGQNGLEIAVALVSTHTAGAPVVDANGKYLGFINEFDAMKMLEYGAGSEQAAGGAYHAEGSACDHPFDENFRRGEDDGATWGLEPAG